MQQTGETGNGTGLQDEWSSVKTGRSAATGSAGGAERRGSRHGWPNVRQRQ